MFPMLKVALKLLANDQGKFMTLVIGIMFSVFLIMQMTSVFSGVMNRSSANILNIGVKMWVMDPSVNIQTDNIPVPNSLLDQVRSISGVQYAMPIYIGGGQVKMPDGRYQSCSIIGLDDQSLLGHPPLLKGDIRDLLNNDSYIVVKDSEYYKLDKPKIGFEFEINNHRAVIVGIGKSMVGNLFGSPTLYTTYSRAISTLPVSRYTMSYILVEPQHESDIPVIKKAVQEAGYLALTDKEFINKNIDYYLKRTGLGTNVLIMTAVSFIVGLSIAGQTFYTFVIENIEQFGALKAIGAKKIDLISMIFFQACVVGFLGYGFGVLMSSSIIALAKYRLPNYASIVSWQNLSISFVMVLVIILVSSYMGIKRVIKIEPFDIFRG